MDQLTRDTTEAGEVRLLLRTALGLFAPMSVARLAALGAVTNLTIGAVLGVVLEARYNGAAIGGNLNGAHPGMMVVGYLIPIGMALVEWRFKGGMDAPRSTLGTIQV